MQRHKTTSGISTVSLDVELQRVEAEIGVSQAIIAGIPAWFSGRGFFLIVHEDRNADDAD
ncbi:MAG: hypothetical protein QM737_23640 [Ferruginibacter sp.]